VFNFDPNRQLACEEPIEKLYAAKFAGIHIHCASPVAAWSDKEEHYPQCEGSSDKPPIQNKKVKEKQEIFNS
jgi:hypothetical protein